jgi:hypothetical protein
MTNATQYMMGDGSDAQHYLDTFRRSEYDEPEKALIAAVLEDAIHDYQKYRRARDAAGKEHPRSRTMDNAPRKGVDLFFRQRLRICGARSRVPATWIARVEAEGHGTPEARSPWYRQARRMNCGRSGRLIPLSFSNWKNFLSH